MKAPYAKKWRKETDKLRQIALDCDLTEEIKWGKSCFTFLKKNVAIVRTDWRAYAGRAMD